MKTSCPPLYRDHHFAQHTQDPGGLARGKVTRDVLDKVFGEALLAAVEVYLKHSTGRHRQYRNSGASDGIDDDGDTWLDELAGFDSTAGKLQVIGLVVLIV